MKNILFILYILLAKPISLFSQNEETKCIKTTWPLRDGCQIDTYNSNDNDIQMIRIQTSTGDTTQWHITEYNERGQKTMRYSVTDNFSEKFATTYQYNSKDELISTIYKNSFKADTTFIPKNQRLKNDHGDDLYDKLLGELGYKYDQNGNQILFCTINEEGDTLSKLFSEYNIKKQLSSTRLMIDDTLSATNKYTYDKNAQLVKEEHFNYLNELVSLTFHEYDLANFRIRSYGESYEVKWEMLFEAIDCLVIKETTKYRPNPD